MPSSVGINLTNCLTLLQMQNVDDVWQTNSVDNVLFGNFQNNFYAFGIKINYLGPIDFLNNSLILTINFAYGQYSSSYNIFRYNEIDQSSTLACEKTADNYRFVIDLINEAHYENGVFTFYVLPDLNANNFCLINITNMELVLSHNNIHPNKSIGVTSEICMSSYYDRRNANDVNKESHAIDIFYPNNFNYNGSYPLVITIHGGNWLTQLNENNTPVYNQRNAYQNNVHFLLNEAGVIVASLEYRLLVFPNESQNSWHTNDENSANYDREMYADNYLDMLTDIGRAINYIKKICHTLMQIKYT